MVITPGGHRSSSAVHEVPLGTILDCSDNNLRIFDSNEKVVMSIEGGAVIDEDQPYMPKHVVLPPNDGGRFRSGWIAYASRRSIAGNPFKKFSTTWRVPQPPLSKQTPPEGHRVVFLFNGAQSSSAILQPVLQYGGSGLEGTGDYWCVAVWYIVSGQAFRSRFVPVKPGDEITGVVTLIQRSIGKFDYVAEFGGIEGAKLTVRCAPELKWCCETLEAYGILGASSYPTVYSTRMRHIRLETGGATDPSLDWTAVDVVTDCGQCAVVVSDSSFDGEVDLCFGTVALPSTAAASWEKGRIDLFALGDDGALYHKYWNECVQGWGERCWKSLGGFLISDPVVVSWGPNRLDVFGVGGDNAMWHIWWTSCEWSPWENLGGSFHSPPAACSWGPNRLDVFGIGTDRQMYHKAWNGSAWAPSGSEWEALGGVFISPPAAVCWGPNRIDVVGLGVDNAIYHKYWSRVWGPSQTGWNSLGGAFNSPPTVCEYGPNRFDIYCLGLDNKCYHNYWSGGWKKWHTDVDTMLNAIQVVCRGPNRFDLVGLGMDHCCYHMSYGSPKNTWTGWNKISDLAMNSVPSIISWDKDRLDVFALGPKNEVRHTSWNGSQWIPVPALEWKDLGPVQNEGKCHCSCNISSLKYPPYDFKKGPFQLGVSVPVHRI